ncbi:3-oxoacyl-[acyl-carrier-protein] synthase III [Anaerobacterium chartisolvens]|uniref:Beta-ketoacyl-[acyl-carrier-protein] synthase III n=1 Tax=Anaerobacterium chartisolvens TaxID=1297424 RepID=A0A369BEQ2_9FIRM|nr:beta-ketoacyl-ACP synthase III [Anaerobacterium chartisolvens]RCX20022.1 3-oxoacyl-[acyl-carrier-protein] synthase III [Anaerobacterium chartisolvens]
MNHEVIQAGILGIGSSLPEKILTNSDLEKMVDTSDEWITKRTGISERRILDKGTPAYEMGAEAAMRAIEDAGISAEDIGLIIAATISPDYMFPQTACLIQGKIGAEKAAAFDLNAACSGFVYAMTVAQQFVSTGYCRYVLIVGCEALSRTLDWEDRNTCVLFGDAAGAAVVGPVEAGYGILSSKIAADGKSGRVVTLPCFYSNEEDDSLRLHENKRVMWMDGGEVFKFAVKAMAQATADVVDSAGLTMDQIKLIFPHQANTRIIEGAMKRLGASTDKVHPIIQKYGNISSASIPVAIDEAVKQGKVQKGDNLALVGFGGGLTWASAVVRWF